MFISPASIRDLSPDEASRASIGTGPFRLVERTDDTLIRLEAFDDHYEGRPAIDELLVRPYSDSAALIAALESGEVDMITSASYDEIDRLQADFDPWQFGTEDAYIVAFNTHHSFTSDARVRQALNLAVNKDAIVSGLFSGRANSAIGPFSPSNRAFDPDRTAYPYDAGQAETLLTQAGYADGASIKAVIPSDIGIPLVPEMAQTIQADLAAVGVNVEFDTVEWNAYLDLVGDGIPDEYAFYITTWGATYPGWLELLHGEASLPPDGPNRGHYVNRDVEELFEQARGEQDADTRIDLYRQAEDLIVQDAPWLYTIYVRFTGLKDPAVDGIREEMVSFDLAKATIERR
jgi:peptide/nickel transport system substrate-binding protein